MFNLSVCCQHVWASARSSAIQVYHLKNLPTALLELTLHQPGWSEYAEDDEIAAQQHALLQQLHHAANLQQLTLQMANVCDWPASLRCTLPASLQTVNVCIAPVGDSCIIDLSGFTPSAGYSAQLHVEVAFDSVLDIDEDQVDEVLTSLAALPSFTSLCIVNLRLMAHWHVFQLQQMHCQRLSLMNPDPGHHDVASGPAPHHPL